MLCLERQGPAASHLAGETQPGSRTSPRLGCGALSTPRRVRDLWVYVQGQRGVDAELSAPHTVPDLWVNIQGQRGVDVELSAPHRVLHPGVRWGNSGGQKVHLIL